MAPVFKNPGRCPICEQDVTFTAWATTLRDHYLCDRCGSIPRERALMAAIARFYPNWRDLKIHESSPADRGTSLKLKSECAGYVSSQYLSSVKEGSTHQDGWRCENIERQTFPNATFDLVITQDVLEHIFDPDAAFREIARTLKPGGAHIATTPLVFGASRPSVQCAAMVDGEVVHHQKPDYHGNPVDAKGSLVTFWWGYDIVDMIDAAAPFRTLLFLQEDKSLGISGPLNEVLISYRI